jgi:hypothetical protein
MYIPRGGDIGFRQMPGLLSRLIRWFGTSTGEARTHVNHVWAHHDARVVVHAVWPRVRRQTWGDVQADTLAGGGEYVIMRAPEEMTPDQYQAWRQSLDESTGRRYSWAECGLQAVDRGLGKLFGWSDPPLLARRLQDVLPGMMCAHVVGKAGGAAGLLPPDNLARYGDPDDLHDLLMRLGWGVVACSPGWATRG